MAQHVVDWSIIHLLDQQPYTQCNANSAMPSARRDLIRQDSSKLTIYLQRALAAWSVLCCLYTSIEECWPRLPCTNHAPALSACTVGLSIDFPLHCDYTPYIQLFFCQLVKVSPASHQLLVSLYIQLLRMRIDKTLNKKLSYRKQDAPSNAKKLIVIFLSFMNRSILVSCLVTMFMINNRDDHLSRHGTSLWETDRQTDGRTDYTISPRLRDMTWRFRH